MRQGQIWENAITYGFMESFEDFSQESSNDELGLTLSFYGKVEFAIWDFIWEEFMDFAEDFRAKVNKLN